MVTSSLSIPSEGSQTVVVYSAPTVTSPSGTTTVNVGQTVNLSVTTGGLPAPTIQWQFSTNGNTWAPFETNNATSTTANLSFVATTAAFNGLQLKACVSNIVQSNVCSSPVTLTVDSAPTVTNPSSPTAPGNISNTAADDDT